MRPERNRRGSILGCEKFVMGTLGEKPSWEEQSRPSGAPSFPGTCCLTLRGGPSTGLTQLAGGERR